MRRREEDGEEESSREGDAALLELSTGAGVGTIYEIIIRPCIVRRGVGGGYASWRDSLRLAPPAQNVMAYVLPRLAFKLGREALASGLVDLLRSTVEDLFVDALLAGLTPPPLPAAAAGAWGAGKARVGSNGGARRAIYGSAAVDPGRRRSADDAPVDEAPVAQQPPPLDASPTLLPSRGRAGGSASRLHGGAAASDGIGSRGDLSSPTVAQAPSLSGSSSSSSSGKGGAAGRASGAVDRDRPGGGPGNPNGGDDRVPGNATGKLPPVARVGDEPTEAMPGDTAASQPVAGQHWDEQPRRHDADDEPGLGPTIDPSDSGLVTPSDSGIMRRAAAVAAAALRHDSSTSSGEAARSVVPLPAVALAELPGERGPATASVSPPTGSASEGLGRGSCAAVGDAVVAALLESLPPSLRQPTVSSVMRRLVSSVVPVVTRNVVAQVHRQVVRSASLRISRAIAADVAASLTPRLSRAIAASVYAAVTRHPAASLYCHACDEKQVFCELCTLHERQDAYRLAVL